MAQKSKSPNERLCFVGGSVSQDDHARILLLAKEWNTNRAQVIGRIVREWMTVHSKEIPSIQAELEEAGQQRMEDLLG